MGYEQISVCVQRCSAVVQNGWKTVAQRKRYQGIVCCTTKYKIVDRKKMRIEKQAQYFNLLLLLRICAKCGLWFVVWMTEYALVATNDSNNTAVITDARQTKQLYAQFGA
jgi:hypothetical protein